MINIRKAIQSHLKTVHPRVYFLKAPESAEFPYLVYEIEVSHVEDDLNMVTLDIDGWDDASDTMPLEILMVNVQNTLNKTITINGDLALFLNLDRKFPLTDPDPKINRRKYIYQGRLYER